MEANVEAVRKMKISRKKRQKHEMTHIENCNKTNFRPENENDSGRWSENAILGNLQLNQNLHIQFGREIFLQENFVDKKPCFLQNVS